jgi:magnesium chelatase subunit D
MVLFLVDASGSMGAQKRMAAAKSAVLGLLLDAYRKRDRVGMVAFRDERAELLLPATNSIDLAERRLRFLPTGGRTPLAHGLEMARETIERTLRNSSALSPMLVLVTDGKANVGLGGTSAWDATLRQAEQIRTRGWPVLLVNPEGNRDGAGLSRALAAALGAECLPLQAINSGRHAWPHDGSSSIQRPSGPEDLA